MKQWNNETISYNWLDECHLVLERRVGREDEDITFDRVGLVLDVDADDNEGVVVVGDAEVVQFLADVGIFFQEGAGEKWHGTDGDNDAVAVDYLDVLAQQLVELQTGDVGFGCLQFLVDIVAGYVRDDCRKLLEDERVFGRGTFGAYRKVGYIQDDGTWVDSFKYSFWIFEFLKNSYRSYQSLDFSYIHFWHFQRLKEDDEKQ